MKQCDQCGNVFEDEATYCNFCQKDLADGHQVIDSNNIEKEKVQEAQTRSLVVRSLVSLVLLNPFLIVWSGASNVANTQEKLVLVLLLETLLISALLLFLNRGLKQFSKFKQPLIWASILMYSFFLPWGIFACGWLIYLCVRLTPKSR